MNRVPSYILAGGRSSRFGSDKALADFNGKHLIEHVRGLLQPAASGFTVVAESADKYAHLGLHTIGDLNPGLGPIGGLQTALNALPHGQSWLLLCPCDAVVIHGHWLEQLLTAGRDGVQAVAFHGDRWQPMPALYSIQCLPAVEDQIREDRRSMQSLLDRLDTSRLPMPIDWLPNWQVNSKVELESA